MINLKNTHNSEILRDEKLPNFETSEDFLAFPLTSITAENMDSVFLYSCVFCNPWQGD